MMEEKEIKKKLIEYFQKLIKEKDIKKRSEIALDIRKFCEKLVKEYNYGHSEKKEKLSLKSFKSEFLHENFWEFLSLPNYEDKFMRACVSQLLHYLRG